jgi:hypothetical protein
MKPKILFFLFKENINKNKKKKKKKKKKTENKLYNNQVLVF